MLLARALREAGDPNAALGVLRAAAARHPGDVWTNYNLAEALEAARPPQHDEAIRFHSIARALRPETAHALADLLNRRGHNAEAEAVFRQIIDHHPDRMDHLCCFGVFLAESGRSTLARPFLDRAIAAARAALRLDPDDAETHCNLGQDLLRTRRFPEALAELRIGHELGSKRPDWSYPSARLIAEVEQKIAANESRLRPYLSNQAPPKSYAERLILARLASEVGRHALAARLWFEALGNDPELAEDRSRSGSYRLKAARAAALAAAGQGEDDPKPDDEARAELRRQALDGLRTELSAWSAMLDTDDPKACADVAPALQQWRQDPDLASVRDPDALAALPEPEREAWAALWADVAEWIARAEAEPPAGDDGGAP